MTNLDRRTVLLGVAAPAATSTIAVPGRASATTPIGLGAVHRVTRGVGMEAALSPNGTVGFADISGVPT